MSDIRSWLEGLGLGKYADAFEAEQITRQAVSHLSEDDLKELGLPMGPRRIVKAVIADDLEPGPSAETPDQEEPAAPKSSLAAPEAERRQLTVMFCDLVGSTELSQKLDPETLRELMRSYQQCCGAVIDKYDGHVAQYLGDGLMTYFGWPRAHEDDAERAIRAGLEIVEAVKQVQAPEPLHVRVGIATGPVVVGETGAGDASVPKLAVGETPNLAARIQGLAGPDQVIIGPDTRRLVGGTFELDDIGEHALKGIVDPVRAWRVTGLASSRGRFDAAHGEALTPLVGREEELDILLRRWQLAQDDEGQVVLLSGEPGIGKSRILSALREKLESGRAKAMRFQCSPYYINSAFWPSIDNFERALKFARDESPESKLDKLESLIVAHYERPLSDVRFIAAMLSIPCEERYGELPMTPQKFKDETLRTLVDLTEAAANKQPSVLLFEDLHWADPTTLEVLDLMVDRVKAMPLLIVLTHRPEFQNRWADHGHVVSLNLSKLTRAQSEAMTSGVAGGKALPDDLLEQIIAKTDGVPLFVEELTKSILESGELTEASDRYEYAGASHSVTIPTTLRDSLMARLDRFTPVKEIAQIGAAIGREFSYELIAAVAPIAQTQLDEALAQLIDSGLAFRRGAPPEATYTFKHALVQDAAYDSLLKSKRQELHGKIASVIEERFPTTKSTEPEVLAHHLTAAGDTEAAIPLWQKAGEFALAHMALTEAISHLNHGLELVDTLPKSAERDASELAVRIPLGTAWMALGGWFHPKVQEYLEPAWQLASVLERSEVMAPILWGLSMHAVTQGRSKESLRWVDEGSIAADNSSNEDLEVVGHMVALVCLFWYGDLIGAKHHADWLLDRYDPVAHRDIAALTNHDPRTLALIYQVNLLWALGFPNQARQAASHLDQHAISRAHYFDQCFAWTLGAWAYVYRGEAQEQASFLEKAYRVGVAQGLPVFSEIQVPFNRGFQFYLLGQFSESIEAFRKGCGIWKAMGGGIALPHAMAYWAESERRGGRSEEGLLVIADALEQINRPGWEERVHLAEVLRVEGLLHEQSGETKRAEKSYLDSLDWAREQQAKGWELRTATSYARLQRLHGRDGEALDLLKPVYDWFTEGFDTKDLKEAKALLDELES